MISKYAKRRNKSSGEYAAGQGSQMGIPRRIVNVVKSMWSNKNNKYEKTTTTTTMHNLDAKCSLWNAYAIRDALIHNVRVRYVSQRSCRVHGEMCRITKIHANALPYFASTLSHCHCKWRDHIFNLHVYRSWNGLHRVRGIFVHCEWLWAAAEYLFLGIVYLHYSTNQILRGQMLPVNEK